MEQESLGNILQQQRIQQGYTIADVEAGIKVRSTYIEAIEKEDFEQLPPRVYTIGFVRRYCAFLQIPDAEPIVQHYKALFAQHEGEEGTVPAMQGIETAGRGNGLKEKRFGNVRYQRILVSFLLILGIAWAGIFTFSFINEKWQSYQLKQAEEKANQPTQEEVPEIETTPQVPVEPVEETEKTPEVVVWDRLQVKLTIRENMQCWLSADADGVQVFSGMKNSGETLEFTAQDQFQLQLGNAGAVQLEINEKDATGADWGVGQVLTFGYTLEQWNQQQLPGSAPVAEQP